MVYRLFQVCAYVAHNNFTEKNYHQLFQDILYTIIATRDTVLSHSYMACLVNYVYGNDVVSHRSLVPAAESQNHDTAAKKLFNFAC